MKYFKYFLYGLGGVLALIFLVALFLPTEYEVKRSIKIELPPERVYEKVADLREWGKWNPWSQGSDTNVYKGADMGETAVWEWHSKEHGNGKLRIVEAEPYKHLKTRLQFRDSTMIGRGEWNFERSGVHTKVTWSTSGDLGYPVGRFMSFFVDDMIGGDLAKGLKNLRAHLEEGRERQV